MRYYVSDDGGVVRPASPTEWAVWFDRMSLAAFEDGGRMVARTELPGDVLVSTVFLGVDHNYSGDGPPLVFETMVFRRGSGGEFWRYTTEADAVKGHGNAVEMVTLEG